MIFPATRTPVAFALGADRLQGDLVLPPGPRPPRAAVVVSGSCGPRDGGRWVEELAHAGLITLTWDSPGWGAQPRRHPDGAGPGQRHSPYIVPGPTASPVSGPIAVPAPSGGPAQSAGPAPYGAPAPYAVPAPYGGPAPSAVTGPWRRPDQRIPEVLAAVDHLAGSADVPVGQVTVIAADLGGWAAVFAAALSPRIEALVLLSPPVGSPREAEVFRLGRRLRTLGFGAAEIELARAVLRARIRRLARGESGPDVYAAEAACRQAPWYRWLPGTTPAEIDAFGGLAGHDLTAILPLVRCPVLALFVEEPEAAATWREAELLQRVLDARGERDHRVMVLPAPSCGGDITWELTGCGPRMFRPGRIDDIGLIIEWLRPRTGRRAGTSAAHS